MRFFFADSLDVIDPGYDFLNERNSPERKPIRDDLFPHEALGFAPYDGLLVSRAIVDRKYPEVQSTKLTRMGARAFFRLNVPGYHHVDILGDSGAFSYRDCAEPPYSPDDTVGFYDACSVTFGCSVDHLILSFDRTEQGMSGGDAEARRRFDLTIENAESFLRTSKAGGTCFTPVGVVQGWSPGSMAKAARRLVAMGYDYIALGGLAMSPMPDLHAALEAVRAAIPATTRLHLLGVARAEQSAEFARYRVSSLDTTSPMVRAFKDGERNYYLLERGRLRYFTAIRIPDARAFSKRMRGTKYMPDTEDLLALEGVALKAVRAYDRHEADLDETLAPIMAYTAALWPWRRIDKPDGPARLERLRRRYEETLLARPWTRCRCRICRGAAVEVMLFRGSNRNKRRGVHNLAAYGAHLRGLIPASDIRAHDVVRVM